MPTSLARGLCLLVGLMFVSSLDAQDDPAAARRGTMARLGEWKLLEPPWASSVVHRESAVLLQDEPNGPLVARLAFPVAELIAVRSADETQTYVLDRDFRLGPDRRTLVFPKPTTQPYLTVAELYVPAGSPNSYRHRRGNPEQNMLYHTGNWFHSRQIEVTYRRTGDWTGATPKFDETRLPKTLAKLRAGQPITLGVSGDSISAGGDASGFAKFAPLMPAFPELVAAQLQATSQSPITLKNRAVGGWSVANGVGDLPKLLEERPDLIIVAYGMNDVGRRDPQWFKDQTQKLLDGIRSSGSAAEVILVAPMLGNAEWVHTPRDMFAAYRDVLAELCGPGVVLADVTAIWTTMLAHKHDLDLIGNGLNHPNDYGHRLYAQTILGVLVAPAR